jgi:outer membrane protein OmpA-like peptidoglycan-associated protein
MFLPFSKQRSFSNTSIWLEWPFIAHSERGRNIMKNYIVLTLLVTTGLALPVLAQQTTPSSQPTQTASMNEREPLPADTHTDFWDGDSPNLVNLVTHPFANKKYVQRMTRPIQDRLNELDEITTENRDKIKDVDARAQHGIQLASAKADMADQHATDAGTKAQTAKMDSTQASTRVSGAEKMVANLDQYKTGTQTEIRFRSGQSVLSKAAKDALDQMADSVKDQRSYIIEVQGFSAGRGQAAIAASQKMADSVVRYLVLSHQIPVFRIYVLSMGNAAVGAEGTAAKASAGGRVEVNLMKNDLVTSAKQ